MAKSQGKLGGKGKTIIPDYTVSEWNGLNTYIKDLKMLQDGETPNSLNWITGRYKDHIELRRGSARLGTTNRLGVGRVSGLGIGYRHDNTQIPFFTFGQKLLYYDVVSNDTLEIGSNFMPVAAANDDFSIQPYQSVAGDFVYLSSPNSSVYKIPVSNPTSPVDLQSTNFRGHVKIDSNVMFLWNRNDTYGNKYGGVLYQSCTDGTQALSGYINETAQTIATGDGTTKNFTGTLPGIPSPKETVFNVEIAGANGGGFSITNMNQAANVAVQTSASTGFVVGQAVMIFGAGGMTQINGLIGFVTNVGSDTVLLSINSTAFSAFTSGGTIYPCEYWIDDKNGNMISSAGGVGTINYATGVYNITFVVAPVGGIAVNAQYYAEDSTNKGIVDFVSSPATFFNQYDGGGDIVAVFPFDQVEYCFHYLKTWYLNINASTPTNLPYRSQLGMPFLRGGFSTDDGIVFIDTSIPSQPKVKALTIDNNSATAVVTVVPVSLSDTLDLSGFGFSQAAVFRWGDYDILTCANSLNGILQNVNAVTFIRNIYSNQWDVLDYSGSVFAQYLGTLLSGDSLSNNLYTLFSGSDDDGSLINNYWQSKLFNLGVPGMKQSNRFLIKGLIQQTQNIDIYFAFDNGSFIKFGTISGTGSYVNLGNPQTVGANTVGSQVVGGGVITAYPFEYEFAVPGPIFEYVQAQFIANNIGFAQIDEFTFKDNRFKSRQILNSSI